MTDTQSTAPRMRLVKEITALLRAGYDGEAVDAD